MTRRTKIHQHVRIEHLLPRGLYAGLSALVIALGYSTSLNFTWRKTCDYAGAAVAQGNLFVFVGGGLSAWLSSIGGAGTCLSPSGVNRTTGLFLSIIHAD